MKKEPHKANRAKGGSAMMQLDLGVKVEVTITGQKEPAITNEVFLIDAVVAALAKMNARNLVTLRNAVNKETLGRSNIITEQTAV